MSRRMAFTNKSIRTVDIGDGFTQRIAVPPDMGQLDTLSQSSLGEAYMTDFLTGRYFHYLNNPHMICYVVCKDDKLVSLTCYYMVDGGKTMIGLASRTDPKYRSQGLMLRSGLIAAEDIKQAWPECTRVRFTTTKIDYYSTADSVKKKVIELESRFLIRCDLHGDIEPPSFSPLEVMTSSDLAVIMQNPTLHHQFFPCNVIMNNTDVYDATSVNINDLFYFNPNRFLIRDSTNKPTSLSIGAILPCNNHTGWRVNFNYHGAIDLTQLKKHINQHVHIVCSKTRKDDIFMILMMPKKFEEEFGREFMTHSVVSIFGRCRRSPTVMYHNGYQNIIGDSDDSILLKKNTSKL